MNVIRNFIVMILLYFNLQSAAFLVEKKIVIVHGHKWKVVGTTDDGSIIAEEIQDPWRKGFFSQKFIDEQEQEAQKKKQWTDYFRKVEKGEIN